MPETPVSHKSGFQLLSSEHDEEEDIHVSLVLIAGLGTLPASKWKFLSPTWLEGILPRGSKAQLLAFDHHLQIDDSLSWPKVLGEGSRLLANLEDLRLASEHSERRPILFVCHSLGGIILKQAIRIASFQHSTYTALLSLFSGIVFLGTPHAQDELDVFRAALDVLLSCCSKHTFHRAALLQLHRETSMLCDVANDSYDTISNLDILSCFEERETRPQRSRRFAQTRPSVVVDSRLARIGAPYEKVVGLSLNHLDLPKLESDDSNGNAKVFEWMRTIISNSAQNLAERLKAYDISESGSVVESNPSSFSAIRKDWLKAGEVGENAEVQNASLTMEDVELAPILEGFAVERKQAKLPCFMMSTFRQNTDFCGRREVLDTLDKHLLPQQGVADPESEGMKCVALWGTGGLGKTEIALQFAFTRKEMFDAIFWIRADDREKLEFDFSQITVALGLENAADPRNPIISRELAKGWLSNPTKDAIRNTEASWLIIFDNADDPDILTDYSQMLGTGSLLVTSRHPLAKEVFSPYSVGVALEPLSPADSSLLLRNLTQHAQGKGDASRSTHVAQRLGGLPLALTQMAGIIRRRFMSYSDFLDIYDDYSEHEQLHEQELVPRRATARGSVASIWAFDDLKPDAKYVLEILTFLDPDCIQERLFLKPLAQLALLPGFPRTKYAFLSARGELMESSLIRRNDDTGDWWIHRVLQDAVRARVSRIPGDLVARFCTAAFAVLSDWPVATPQNLHAIENWQTCKEIYPHVLFLRDIYSKHSSLKQAKDMIDFATLLNKAAWWQYERGNSHSLRPLAELALDICKRCEVSRTKNLLSDIYYTLGAVGTEANDRVSSLRYNRLFLDGRLGIAEETGIEDVRLGIAHNQIGVSLMMHEDFAEAMDHFQQATRVYKALPEFDLQYLALPTANLGLAFWLQGKYKEAASTLKQGLADRVARWGPDDTESFRTGRLLHAMGNVKFSQGRLDDSEKYHRKALSHYQATIGNDHHRTADVCHRVAQHCMRRGDLKQARTIIDQALKVWNADRKVYRNEVARTSFLKANVLARLGENESALICFGEAKALRMSILPASAAKAGRDLVEEDFDQLVTFWSKDNAGQDTECDNAFVVAFSAQDWARTTMGAKVADTYTFKIQQRLPARFGQGLVIHDRDARDAEFHIHKSLQVGDMDVPGYF